MTLNFIDSMDGYTDDLDMEPKWDSGGLVFGEATGRFSETNGAIAMISASYNVERDSENIGTSDKLIVGFGYYIDTLTDQHTVLEFRDATAEMAKLVLNTDGTLDLVVDSSVVHSSTLTITKATWHYIEVKILFSATVGTVEFQIDGGTDTAETDTLNTIFGGSECDKLRWISTGTDRDWRLDDVYIADNNGNDFLGDVRILSIAPDADSSVAFTPNEGTTNYTQVNDEQNDPSAVDYVQSSTSAHVDLYTFPSFGLVAADTVHALQTNMWTKKVDAGGVNMILELDNGAGSDTSSAFTQTETYGWFSKMFLLDIDSGTPVWDDASVDTIVAGFQRV